MSSPAVRNLDDDIDIDFDDYQGGVQLVDDEHMQEDADPTRPTTATDDIMDDDILPGEQVHVDEEIMQDDGEQMPEMQNEEDEELIDYGDEDFLDQPFDDAAASSTVEEPGEALDTGAEEAEEEISRDIEDGPPTDPGLAVHDNNAAEQHEFDDPTVNTEAVHATLAHTEETLGTNLGQDLHGQRSDKEEDAAASLQEHEEHEGRADDVLPPISVDTAQSAPSDVPGTPTDTGLHPMTVRYHDIQIPLFKSRRQPDGLLKDDNLANLSLAELIKNCRQRLAIKGEDVSEDQEVLLGFDSMGLMLVEVCDPETCSLSLRSTNCSQDSRMAFECSLNDVLEVYLQLHQNDGIEEIPPLSLTLTPQLKFSSSFSIFKQAAAGGQGMSSFGFLQPPGDNEFHEDYEEDAAEDDQGEFQTGTFQEHFDETSHPHHAYQEGYEDQEEEEEAEEQDVEQPSTSEQHHPNARYTAQEERGGEKQEEEEHVPNDHEDDLQHLGEVHEDDFQSADAIYTAPLGETNQDAFAKESDPPPVDIPGGGEKATSAASSTTVQGDPVDGSTGEYDEDLIDWDDDTLTSVESELAPDGQEDFSTFLTEYEDHEELPAGERKGIAIAQSANEIGNPVSEDFLNDLGDGETRGSHIPEQDSIEEYGFEGDAQGYYDQADTYHEQQEDDYHPDYQPGEEDDLYHTAQDFLDGQAYEHGLEHDVHGEDDVDDTVGTVVINRPTNDLVKDQDQENFEDDLGFDEVTEQQPPSEAQESPITGATGSPLGKRSFDDFDEVDNLDDDTPDLKKARSS